MLEVPLSQNQIGNLVSLSPSYALPLAEHPAVTLDDIRLLALKHGTKNALGALGFSYGMFLELVRVEKFFTDIQKDYDLELPEFQGIVIVEGRDGIEL